MNEPACGLVHGQGAETMAKERERPVQESFHLENEPLDKLLHVGNRWSGNAAEPPGRLDCDHLDRGIDELRPVSINRGASAGEREAKQPNSGSRSWAHDDQPVAGVTFGLERDRLRPAAATAGRRIRCDWPTPNTMFRPRHN